MKTDQMLDLLAADHVIDPLPRFINVLLVAIFLTVAAILLAFISLSVMSMRPDYMDAIGEPLVMAKQILPFLLVVILTPFMSEMLRPEANLRRAALRIAPFFLMMALLFVFAYRAAPAGTVQMAIVGKSLQRCLTMIPVLSLPAYGAMVYFLRRGAPTHPAQSGFIAGIFAGALGCFVYAFACDQDNPLFYAIWYSVGILASGGIGALIGVKALRW